MIECNVGSRLVSEASQCGGQCVVDARPDDVHAGTPNGMQKRDITACW